MAHPSTCLVRAACPLGSHAMTSEEEEEGAGAGRSSAHFCISCLRSPEHTTCHRASRHWALEACLGALFTWPGSCTEAYNSHLL